MATTTKDKSLDRYLKLIRAFPLRRIDSPSQHAKAKQIMMRLSSSPQDRGTFEYLDVLIDLIADYEKRRGLALDTSKVSAADLVRHRLQERGMSMNAAAKLIGVPQSNLSDMLAGKRRWSRTAIKGFAGHFNINPMRFM